MGFGLVRDSFSLRRLNPPKKGFSSQMTTFGSVVVKDFPQEKISSSRTSGLNDSKSLLSNPF